MNEEFDARYDIVVVGAVRATEARDRIAAAFGDWSAARPQRTPAPEAPALTQCVRRHITMPGKSQTTLLLGHPEIGRAHV